MTGIQNSSGGACEVCLSGRYASRVRFGAHTYEVCGACGSERLIRPHGDSAALYQEQYYSPQTGERFGAWVEWVLQLFRRGRARRVTALLQGTTGGRVLDVGCGRGTLVELLNAQGVDAEGTQVSLTAAEAARARGVTVHVGDLRELPLKAGIYDIVTMYHVLEHLEDLPSLLERVADLLKTHGYAVIEIPNANSLLARWATSRWLGLDPPFHIHQINADRLAVRLATRGLVQRQRSDFSWEYSPFTVIQTLLNLLLPGQANSLYRYLRHRGNAAVAFSASGRFWTAISVGLLPLAALLSAPYLLASIALRRGDTVQLVLQKRPPGSSDG